MDIHNISTSQDRWNELGKELTECAFHFTDITLTGMRGFSQRMMRALETVENNNLARIESLNSGNDIQSIINSETRILQASQEKFVEDSLNLVQVSMLTQSEMRYWFESIIGIMFDTKKNGV